MKRARVGRSRIWFFLACATVASACGGESAAPLGPTVPLKVMTRNLYLGSEIASYAGITSVDEIPARAAAFWQTVQDSDFPGRAKLIVDEIVAFSPDLVGLQEVERFRTQSPSDYSFAAPVNNAETVALDFLALLMTELAARGARYKVAVESIHSDVELPMSNGTGGFVDMRMTDYDVILAREELQIDNPVAENFDARIPYRIGGTMGPTITLVRGYARIDVTFSERKVTFVNTHLEVGGVAAIFQEDQAEDLLMRLNSVAGTIVLVGDFNSAADGSTTQSYARITRGYQDAWTALGLSDSGFTCCSDLKQATFDASSRIDIVFFKGQARADAAQVVGTSAKTASGLFASDHAGVAVTLGIAQ